MVIAPLQALQNHGPSCNLMPPGLGGAVLVVAVVAMVTEYHVRRIIVLPTPYTRTVILWRHGLSKQGSFTPMKSLPQTKGTTGDLVSHARGLVCWKRQPFRPY